MKVMIVMMTKCHLKRLQGVLTAPRSPEGGALSTPCKCLKLHFVIITIITFIIVDPKILIPGSPALLPAGFWDFGVIHFLKFLIFQIKTIGFYRFSENPLARSFENLWFSYCFWQRASRGRSFQQRENKKQWKT